MKEYDKRYAFGTAYEYFGVHREGTTYIFRVWAPHADMVYVVGDFNGWSESYPMTRLDGGVWERLVRATDIREGDLYKYKIKNGSKELYKADPYSFCSKDANETASVVRDIFGYVWRDKSWLEYRRNSFGNKPINIYKIHAPSWKRHDNGAVYSWRELATELAPYVKQMGYTHVELMPIMEQADDRLFGYIVDSFYAPSARMGGPLDFMCFVDSMHEAGIGVIFDLMLSRFAKNEYSLADFDGQPLYEKDCEESLNETRIFDVGRYQVKIFLVSNACFWINVYHADGIRLDVDFETKTDISNELRSIVKDRFPDVLFPKEDALIMGREIGQDWEKERTPSVNWHLLDFETNRMLQYRVAERNHLYLKEPTSL